MLAGQAQNSGMVDNERPPYLAFEEREVEDRAKTMETGSYATKMRDLVAITRPGSRDSIEKWVDEWLPDMKNKSRQNLIPPVWFQSFEAQYKQWKEGVTTEGVEGTPIVTWPVIGKSLAKSFINAGIRSVEDLAQIPDQDLQTLGTGALGMKQKAKLWLEQASGPGKMTQRLADLENKLTQLVDLTREQAAALAAKDAQITALTASKSPI